MSRRLAHIKDGVVVQCSEGAEDNASHQAWLADVASQFDAIIDVTGQDVDRNYTWSEANGFRPAQPYSSWSWSKSDGEWVAPVPKPDDSAYWVWDEKSGEWKSF
jgi:hypothetical protein